MPNKFDPGDLIILNGYGIFITPVWEESIGIVISKPYSILEGEEEEGVTQTFYIVYDILLNGELLRMVPQEFMDKAFEDRESHEKKRE